MVKFPELSAILTLSRQVGTLGEVREHGRIKHEETEFPLLSFHFGVKDEQAPTLVFVAGVHGLEKIGTHILISFLASWMQLLRWDKPLQASLATCRVVFYPLVNPVGMDRNTRSNGQGVDLMRNAPIDATGRTWPLIAGHRISPALPWYRGKEGMETEASALCSFIQSLCFQGASTVVLDIHSGFGLKDSLWFPFAGNSRYFPEAARVLMIKQLFDRSYPHHPYAIEPQHLSYMSHGDLWDYLFGQFEQSGSKGHFIPLCLEIGSWTWVRKNPRQLFSSLGLFNPMLPHRIQRAERRHFLLLNFLLKIVASPDAWVDIDRHKLSALAYRARRLWYEK